MNHEEIRAAVRCPKCGAAAGEKCIEGGVRRATIHPARVMHAETVGGWKARDHGPPRNAAGRERMRAARYGRRRRR
jgi:hypothetical protein